MSSNFEDSARDDVTPNLGNDIVVSALAAGSAWVAMTPPAGIPAGNFRSYILTLAPALLAYEVTWKPSPLVGDAGLEVPAATFWTTPRMATPGVSSENGWPSFRAIGAAPVTIRGMLARPVP